MQLTLDIKIHQFENNPLSQAHLDQHREKFSRDTYEVLRRFVIGERWNYKSAINAGLTGDIRARVHDLKLMGIPVSSEWIKTDSGRGFKEYFMTDTDRIQALRVLMNKMDEAA